MTGKEPDPEKIPLTSFTLKYHKTLEVCPEGHTPFDCQFNGKNKVIIAHFNRDTCKDMSKTMKPGKRSPANG